MNKLINNEYLLNYLFNFYQSEYMRIHKKNFKNVLYDIKYLGKKYNNCNILSMIITDYNLEINQYYSCPPRYRHLGEYNIINLVNLNKKYN